MILDELIVYDLPCRTNKSSRKWCVIGFRNYPRMKPIVLWERNLPLCTEKNKKMWFVPKDDVMLIDVDELRNKSHVRIIWKPDSISTNEALNIISKALNSAKVVLVA